MQDKNSQKGSNILTDLKEKTRQHALENEALKRLRKEYSDNIKIEGAASDSLVALRKQLSLLNAEYDRLSATDRKTTVGTNLQKQIQALNTEIVRRSKLPDDINGTSAITPVVGTD